MSTITNTNRIISSSIEDTRKITEPPYYHRKYSNDIPKDATANKGSWVHTAQRVGMTALPFLSLYKPLNFPISLGMGALRTYTCGSQLFACIKSGNTSEIPYQLLQTAIAVIALAGTIFAHPVGMFISTGYDLIMDVARLINHLQKGEYQQAMECCFSIISNALYLSLFLHGGVELAIASLAVQILLGLYHSRAEFLKGNYIEAVGHVGMALVRGNQLAAQAQMLQMKWKIESAIAESKKAELQRVVTSKGSSLESKEKIHEKLLNQTNPEYSKELAEVLNKYGNNSDLVHALLLASYKGDLESVKVLVKNGADVNAFSDGKQGAPYFLECPLVAAISHPNIVKFLIESGVNVNVKLTCSSTPLHCASHGLHFESVRLLVKHGADVNAKDSFNRTPLFDGVRDKKIALFLLDHGADLYATDGQGLQPLHSAYKYGNINLLKALVKRGVSLSEFDPSGWGILHYTVCNPYITQQERLKLLKWIIDEQKINVDACAGWWRPAFPPHRDGIDGAYTPLMLALANQDNFKVAEFLLSRGADINFTLDYYTNNYPLTSGTILDWARIFKIHGNYYEIINWLIQHGAKSKS